jgi:hypothetical protein
MCVGFSRSVRPSRYAGRCSVTHRRGNRFSSHAGRPRRTMHQLRRFMHSPCALQLLRTMWQACVPPLRRDVTPACVSTMSDALAVPLYAFLRGRHGLTAVSTGLHRHLLQRPPQRCRSSRTGQLGTPRPYQRPLCRCIPGGGIQQDHCAAADSAMRLAQLQRPTKLRLMPPAEDASTGLKATRVFTTSQHLCWDDRSQGNVGYAKNQVTQVKYPACNHALLQYSACDDSQLL